jgi:CRP-like cAMP-binding protein
MSASELGLIYRDGEMIIRQGESGDRMYVILEGQAEVQVACEHETHRMALLDEGDFFGEMEVFDPGLRSATVRAVGRTRVLTVDKRGILRRLQEDPELAMRILETLARRMRRESRKQCS